MQAKTTSPQDEHPWDRAAQGWNRYSPVVNAWLADVTQAMLAEAKVGPGARVLDVAAGAGGQTLAIARLVGDTGQVWATDISPRILALAQENAAGAGFANVRTQVADAQALGLAGAGFDCAVSRLGLMFCTDPGAALGGIAQALKAGGHFAAVVFSHPQANPCAATLMSTACRHAGRPPPPPFEPGTLFSLGKPGLMAELLRSAGFASVAVRPVAAPFHLPSARHYLEFVRAAGSPVIEILAQLAPAAQQAAWDDMAAALERFAQPSGWTGPNELLLCSACRPV
ncbi:MAG: methyltransferase domain-containing protein [Pseudomonadota bacterium]